MDLTEPVEVADDLQQDQFESEQTNDNTRAAPSKRLKRKRGLATGKVDVPKTPAQPELQQATIDAPAATRTRAKKKACLEPDEADAPVIPAAQETESPAKKKPRGGRSAKNQLLEGPPLPAEGPTTSRSGRVLK